MRLRIRALGVAVSIVGGLFVLASTLWAMWFTPVTDINMWLVLFPSYEVSYWGALVGLFWGFLYGFVAGGSIAWLYNRLHKVFYKSEAAK